MTKPRIIVTGATGKTGGVVVTELLKAGYPVRAMVHREDGRSARLKAQGAEIVVADMSDAERVFDALRDVQRDSGSGRFCNCCEGSPPRTNRRHDPMAGEPLASLAHDPAALVGRPSVLNDAWSGAYDPRPGLFC